MQENVKKALAQKSTVERMSTEELLGHAQRKAAQKTLTPESEEKLVQTVRGQVAAWQEKTKSTLSAMSNDQVWKECMKAAKHPKYPELPSMLRVIPRKTTCRMKWVWGGMLVLGWSGYGPMSPLMMMCVCTVTSSATNSLQSNGVRKVRYRLKSKKL